MCAGGSAIPSYQSPITHHQPTKRPQQRTHFDAAGETNPYEIVGYSANLIELTVSSFLPSTSLTVPVAVTFLGALQMLS